MGTGLYYYRARYYSPAIGRFISEDPLQFDSDGANFYAYAFNNPTNLIDPSGLRPDSKYSNKRCAGWHAIWDINQTSKRQNREFGGWMYANPDRTYSYAAPVMGGPAGMRTGSFASVPNGTSIAGWYHTHAAYDAALNSPGNPQPGAAGYNWHYDGNEVFSTADERISDSRDIPGYLGTPQGTTEEYVPTPGEPLNEAITVLTGRNCGCH
jgi:uncharacterized protein RhaS with RHS repeats